MSTKKPAAKPAATKKPAVKPAATKKPAAKPAATKKPAAKPAEDLFEVRLRPNFPAPSRRRAGVVVSRIKPLQTTLTAEQLKAIKADPEFTVTPVSRQMVDKQDSKEA